MKTKLAALCVLLLPALFGCGTGNTGSGDRIELRLGYLPNITHASALIGLEEGIFEDVLGPGVRLKPQLFSAGGQALEGFFAGGLDAAYVGPSPAINAYEKSHGEAVRIVSGATAGGVFFVVQPWVSGAEDLRGERLAAPQYGNTQDVALRSWLADHGIRTENNGEGDAEIVYQDSAQTLATFQAGGVAGAWVPEPWASRLVLEAGGKVLVDESDLWPGGRFATTLLVVHPQLLADYPDVVERLVSAHRQVGVMLRTEPDRSMRIAGEQIEDLTGAALADEVLRRAWGNLTFTDDPIVPSLVTAAQEAAALGLVEPIDLAGAIDLGIINRLRAAAGQAPIETGV